MLKSSLFLIAGKIICNTVKFSNDFMSFKKLPFTIIFFIYAYEFMLGLHVFRKTGPPRRVDCLIPPICLPHKDGGIPLCLFASLVVVSCLLCPLLACFPVFEI